MKQRLIYLLKHNLFLQKLYKFVVSVFLRFIGLFISTDEKTILFSSFMGSNFNDSPKAIYDYLSSREKYSGYKCVWAFEHPENYPQLNTVKIDTLKYFTTALKAKYWVTNTNIERGLSFKKKRTVYLNTWHGIALKKIGNDCPGRKDYNFGSIDYLCVSGKHDERVFKSAFNADEKSYLRCGMPRNDKLWNSTENDRLLIRRSLGVSADKKIILYAPTWRDSVNGGKSYDIKPPINFNNWKKKLGDEYIVLFRAHHITTKVMNIEFDDFVRDVSNYSDVNDLLIAADILITDYSAIAFDFSILCKPIFCFAYDYDSYLLDRGTYFNIDELYPNKSCRTEDELLLQIKNIDDDRECAKTKIFRDRFIQYGDNAIKICTNALFGSEGVK